MWTVVLSRIARPLAVRCAGSRTPTFAAEVIAAASEDPELARDEVWGAMERLVGGLMRRSSAQR